MENPFIDQHIETEMAFTDGEYTPAIARQVVLNEYADGPDPMECDCGKTAYYRPGPGCLKCPACGALYMPNGERI